MGQLLIAMNQETTADNIDPDELEARSDIQMLELETGWVAIRTAAVEEQSSACQLVMLIADRLQEYFYPYVEPSVRALVPLLESPHDDVRSYCMAAMPELIRATAKATSPDRTGLMVLTDYVIGQLLKTIETESTLELIMTGLQALRHVFMYACTSWEALRPFTTKPPPKSTPQNSLPFLSHEQMRKITQCATIVLRDSLQRRAVLRAEAQVTGTVDDDDIADEEMFQFESMELHFNLAELLGIIFRTHGVLFLEIYQEVWHEAVCTMAHLHCLKEDRQFAYFVISDVMEFGLSDEIGGEYYKTVLPLLYEGCVAPEPNIRQTCAYAIGMAAEVHPHVFRPYSLEGLNVLASCIAIGENEDEPRGTSTDNAVSAVGTILEQMEAIQPPPSVGTEDDHMTDPFPYIWGQWLSYLPLRDDVVSTLSFSSLRSDDTSLRCRRKVGKCCVSSVVFSIKRTQTFSDRETVSTMASLSC
jgi:importin-5